MIPFGYILFEKTPGQNIKGKTNNNNNNTYNNQFEIDKVFI